MDKIICDICGTAYPENAEACPICGYPRQDNEKVIAQADANSVILATKPKVKGGRFSNKNVKKRNKAAKAAAQPQEDYSDGDTGEEDTSNPNKPLLIVIAILLAAIALVSVYIGVRFFRDTGGKVELPKESTTETTTAPIETTSGPAEVHCAAVSLEAGELTLGMAGKEYQLKVTTVPADTTDVVTYASSDESVATVSETGLITAVGSGRAMITVTCGEAKVVCTVTCSFETAPETTVPPETTEATEPSETTAPVQQPSSDGLTLSHTDASLFAKGEAFTITVTSGNKTISRSDVKWSTSDAAIATVDNGVVTAVGSGVATITASYDGKSATCLVRCRFEDEDTGSENNSGGDSAWTISHQDVTISVGEQFRLTVKNASGETANVTWSMSQEGIVTVSGNTVTGAAAGTVTLSATVDGVTYSCVIRVK